jgi:amidophosphoribosyltransferase
MPSREELIASHKGVPEITAAIRADSLAYLSLQGLAQVVGRSGVCNACFTGDYPIPVPVPGETGSSKLRFEGAPVGGPAGGR